MNDSIKSIVNQECENNYAQWLNEVMTITRKYEHVASGLTQRIEPHLVGFKVSFFRDYKLKVDKKIKEITYRSLEELRVKRVTTKDVDSKEVLIEKKSLQEINDRIKLEAYFLAGKNAKKAANDLGIPRSTYFDWVSNNKELILSEEARV